MTEQPLTRLPALDLEHSAARVLNITMVVILGVAVAGFYVWAMIRAVVILIPAWRSLTSAQSGAMIFSLNGLVFLGFLLRMAVDRYRRRKASQITTAAAKARLDQLP